MMETTELTRERRDREEIVRDLNSSMFLEAGAGAGKTHILTERITRQLTAGAAPEQIVAITFTNKAAQELKDRISRRVRQALHEAADGSEEKANLCRALRELDRMQISTIHSFCRRLLTEQTFLAGLRMDMELIEEDAEREAKEAFFRRWYQAQSYDRIRHVRENYAGRRVADVLRRAFCETCDLPAETDLVCDTGLLEKTLQEFRDEGAEMTDDFSAIVLDRIEQACGSRPDSLEQAAEQGYFMSRFATLLKELLSGKKDAFAFMKSACSPSMTMFRTGKGLGKSRSDCDAADDACRKEFAARHDPERLAREFAAYQNALVMDFIRPAREEYRRQTRNRYVTNDMLLQKARDLVKDHPEARAFFREKFRCVYVDEFQDTDHVQADLIFALCSDENGRLRPGSLFVVGDPKQSIYRFRGADLPLYYSIRDRMAGMENCRMFSLNMNFRSGTEVIEFVNRNGERLLPGYRAMFREDPLPAEEKPENVLSGVYVTWDTERPVDGQFPWNKEADAAATADIIASLVGGQKAVWDKGLKRYRPVRYRDFLVLCYGQTGMEDYLAQMVFRDIPVQISGRMPLAGVRELRRFAALFRYLAYPGYGRAEEGALQAVLGETNAEENTALGQARLERLREAVRGMDGLSAALWLARRQEYFLDWNRRLETHYLQRVQAQVQQMIETAAADVPNHPQTLADAFMAWLDGVVDRELTLSEEADAVRLMNLHKAKGLEGRIVIVCKRNEDFTFRGSSMQIRQAGREGYLFYHTVTEENSSGFGMGKTYPAYGHDDGVRQRAEAEELGEYRRLEYVEATRAMEAIIFMPPFMSGQGKEIKNRYSFRDYDFSCCRRLEGFPPIAREEGLAEEEEERTDGIPPAEYDYHRWDPAFTETQHSRTWLRLTPSSLETDGASETDDLPADDDRPAGALFGTVMHRAFELLVREIRKTGGASAEIREICVAQAVMGSWEELAEAYGDDADREAERYRSFLVRVLRDFAEQSDIPTLVLRADRVYTEMPFSFFTDARRDGAMFEALRRRIPQELAAERLPEDPDIPVWVNGKADLVLVGGDGTVTVVDYKSDRNPGLSPEAFRETVERRYGGQMELYRRVCARLFNVPAENVYGCFCTLTLK